MWITNFNFASNGKQEVTEIEKYVAEIEKEKEEEAEKKKQKI